MQNLHIYDPILAGTIPLNIDIETSDIDIICYCKDYCIFTSEIKKTFGEYNDFSIRKRYSRESKAVVANFKIAEIRLEIFGQDIPVCQQNAYRHMITEYNLLVEYGEEFRKRIIELKSQGYKTEHAFAYALGLQGDPYQTLLEYHKDSGFPNRTA